METGDHRVVGDVQATGHLPVLPTEVMAYLDPEPGGRYIDGTLGGGGHTGMLLEWSAPTGQVLGIDTDLQALTRVRQRFANEIENNRLVLAHGNFSDLTRIARESGFLSLQGVLLDLGFSSDQMDTPERGFAFSHDGPLDMRLNQDEPQTAADLINSASEEEIADIIWRYGEERRSRQIARRIVRAREQKAITRTSQLAELAATGVPFKPGSIHPATRTFQALRIAINGELDRLTAVLPQMLEVLQLDQEEQHGGRMAIISFHSLEDRIVKEFFQREAKDCICPPQIPVCVCEHKARLRILTRKPISASLEEVAANPRARSAKLRVAQMIA